MLRGIPLIIVFGIVGGVPLGTHSIREPEVHSDVMPGEQASQNEHPLAPVLDLARQTQRYVPGFNIHNPVRAPLPKFSIPFGRNFIILNETWALTCGLI